MTKGKEMAMNLNDRFSTSPSFIISGLHVYKCWTCGALVESDDREMHNDWHSELEALTTALNAAAQRGVGGAAASGVAPQHPPNASQGDSMRNPTHYVLTPCVDATGFRPRALEPDEVLPPGTPDDTVTFTEVSSYPLDVDTRTRDYSIGVDMGKGDDSTIVAVRQCPHCSGTGSCSQGFPLPIACSLCTGSRPHCCNLAAKLEAAASPKNGENQP